VIVGDHDADRIGGVASDSHGGATLPAPPRPGRRERKPSPRRRPVRAGAAEHFHEEELANLLFAIAAINFCTLVAISAGTTPAGSGAAPDRKAA
jgi:hypothetical protein